MKVLIGTTNYSKINRFKNILKEFDIEIITLNELQIEKDPEEVGLTIVDNALIKAAYYGKFFNKVICNDSGLYIEDFDINDSRQPGLKIRRINGNNLNDEEMIAYYSNLAKENGGMLSCYYMDAFAVYNNGTLSSFVDDMENIKKRSFFMTSIPHEKRHAGWPLDSIAINKSDGSYFVEKGNYNYDNVITGKYLENLVKFFEETLNLKEIEGGKNK